MHRSRESELAAYIQTLPPGTSLDLRKLSYFGSSKPVRQALIRLSHPITGLVQARGDRWTRPEKVGLNTVCCDSVALG